MPSKKRYDRELAEARAENGTRFRELAGYFSAVLLLILMFCGARVGWFYMLLRNLRENELLCCTARCVGKSRHTGYRTYTTYYLSIKTEDGALIEEQQVRGPTYEEAQIDGGLLLVRSDGVSDIEAIYAQSRIDALMKKLPI